MKNRWVAFSVVFGGLLLLDQLTKAYILSLYHSGSLPISVWPFFTIRLIWNKGISFGILNTAAGAPWWLFVIIGILLGVLLTMLWKQRKSAMAWPIVLILSGAVGNIVDRFRFHAVVDFLDFFIPGTPWGTLHWPAFNVADAAITIGALWLAYRLYKQ